MASQKKSLGGLKPIPKSDLSLPAPFIVLFLVWGVAFALLASPLVASMSTVEKIIVLAIPAVLSVLVVLLDIEHGMTFWVLGLTLLVTQTGFQLDISTLRTSALELMTILLMVILFFDRTGLFKRVWALFPGRVPVTLFALFSLLMLFVGVIQGDNLLQALSQLKGFLIYPLMGILLAAGIRSTAMLRWVIGIVLAWYVLVAGWGILQFVQGQNMLAQDYLFRASGEYAPINIYGITLMACALLLAGIVISTRGFRSRVLGSGLMIWLIIGMLVSVSRSALLGLVIGLIVLFLERKSLRMIIVGLILVGLAAWALSDLLPHEITNRLFQLSDSSTVRREFYLESGWQALLTFWAYGGGWGNGYWYVSNAGLVKSGFMPWYHNDFLNLAVQIGVFGAFLYILFWGRVVQTGWLWLRTYATSQPELVPFARGALAALIGLLVAAVFEHVLWRPDIAGLVGWMLGILIAIITLQKRFAEDTPA